MPKRCCGAEGFLLPGRTPPDAGQMLPGDGGLQERRFELQLGHGEQATVGGPLPSQVVVLSKLALKVTYLRSK